MSERNMLIEAYRGAGHFYLASRLALLLATDEEIKARSDPAVRDHYAKELRLLMGDEELQRLCLEMADRALLMMTPDVEGESNNA